MNSLMTEFQLPTLSKPVCLLNFLPENFDTKIDWADNSPSYLKLFKEIHPSCPALNHGAELFCNDQSCLCFYEDSFLTSVRESRTKEKEMTLRKENITIAGCSFVSFDETGAKIELDEPKVLRNSEDNKFQTHEKCPLLKSSDSDEFNKLISLIKPFLSRSSSVLRSLHLGNAIDSEVMDNVEYSEAVLRKLFEDFDFVKKGFFIKKTDYSITLLGPKLTEVGRNVIKVYWPLCQGQTYIYLTRKYGQALSICTLLVLGLVWMTGISFKFNRFICCLVLCKFTLKWLQSRKFRNMICSYSLKRVVYIVMYFAINSVYCLYKSNHSANCACYGDNKVICKMIVPVIDAMEQHLCDVSEKHSSSDFHNDTHSVNTCEEFKTSEFDVDSFVVEYLSFNLIRSELPFIYGKDHWHVFWINYALLKKRTFEIHRVIGHGLRLNYDEKSNFLSYLQKVLDGLYELLSYVPFQEQNLSNIVLLQYMKTLFFLLQLEDPQKRHDRQHSMPHFIEDLRPSLWVKMHYSFCKVLFERNRLIFEILPGIAFEKNEYDLAQKLSWIGGAVFSDTRQFGAMEMHLIGSARAVALLSILANKDLSKKIENTDRRLFELLLSAKDSTFRTFDNDYETLLMIDFLLEFNALLSTLGFPERDVAKSRCSRLLFIYSLLNAFIKENNINSSQKSERNKEQFDRDMGSSSISSMCVKKGKKKNNKRVKLQQQKLNTNEEVTPKFLGKQLSECELDGKVIRSKGENLDLETPQTKPINFKEKSQLGKASELKELLTHPRELTKQMYSDATVELLKKDFLKSSKRDKELICHFQELGHSHLQILKEKSLLELTYIETWLDSKQSLGSNEVKKKLRFQLTNKPAKKNGLKSSQYADYRTFANLFEMKIMPVFDISETYNNLVAQLKKYFSRWCRILTKDGCGGVGLENLEAVSLCCSAIDDYFTEGSDVLLGDVFNILKKLHGLLGIEAVDLHDIC